MAHLILVVILLLALYGIVQVVLVTETRDLQKEKDGNE